MNKFHRRLFSYLILGSMSWQYLFPVLELAGLVLAVPPVIEANHSCGNSCDEFTAEGACTHGCWGGGDPNPDYRGGEEYRHEESAPAVPGTDAGSDEGARQAREAEAQRRAEEQRRAEGAARQTQQQQAQQQAPPPQPTSPPPPPPPPPQAPVSTPGSSGCFGPWDCGGNQYCAGAGSYPTSPGACVTPAGGQPVNQDRTNEQIQRDFVAAGGNPEEIKNRSQDFAGALGAEAEQKEPASAEAAAGKEGQKAETTKLQAEKLSDIFCNYCGGFWADPNGAGCRDQAIGKCPDESGLKPAVVGGQCFNANSTPDDPSPCGKNGYGSVDIDDNGDGAVDRTEFLTSTAAVEGKCGNGREPTAGRCFDPLPQAPEAATEAAAAALGSSILEAEELEFLRQSRAVDEAARYQGNRDAVTGTNTVKVDQKILPPTAAPLPTQRLKDDVAFPTAAKRVEACRSGIGRNPDGSCAETFKQETKIVSGVGAGGEDVQVSVTSFCRGSAAVSQIRNPDGSNYTTENSCYWGCSAGSCRNATPEEAQVYRYSVLQNAIDQAKIRCRQGGGTARECTGEAVYYEAVSHADGREISPQQVAIRNSGVTDAQREALVEAEFQKLVREQAALASAGEAGVGIIFGPIDTEALRRQAEKKVDEVIATYKLSETGGNMPAAVGEQLDKIGKLSAEEAKKAVESQGFLYRIIAHEMMCDLNNNYASANRLTCGFQTGSDTSGKDFWQLAITGKSEQGFFDQGMIVGDPRNSGFQGRDYDANVVSPCGVKPWERSVSEEERACLDGRNVAAQFRLATIDEQNRENAALNLVSAAAGFGAGAVFGGIKAGSLAGKAGLFAVREGVVSDVTLAPVFAEAMTAGDRAAAEALAALAKSEDATATERRVWQEQAEEFRMAADEAYNQNVLMGAAAAVVMNVAGTGVGKVVGEPLKEALGEHWLGKVLFGPEAAAKAAAREAADELNAAGVKLKGGRRTEITAEDVLGIKETLTEVEVGRMADEPMIAVSKAMPAGEEVADWPILAQGKTTGNLFYRAGQTVGAAVDQVAEVPATAGRRIGNMAETMAKGVDAMTESVGGVFHNVQNAAENTAKVVSDLADSVSGKSADELTNQGGKPLFFAEKIVWPWEKPQYAKDPNQQGWITHRDVDAYRPKLFPDETGQGQYHVWKPGELTPEDFSYGRGAEALGKIDENKPLLPHEVLFEGEEGFFAPGKVVVDLGSGEGIADIQFSHRNRDAVIIGVDLGYAKATSPDLSVKGKPQFVKGSWDDLQSIFLPRSVDSFMSVQGAFRHADDVEKLVSEITVVAKPGAVVRGDIHGNKLFVIDAFQKRGWAVYDVGSDSFVARYTDVEFSGKPKDAVPPEELVNPAKQEVEGKYPEPLPTAGMPGGGQRGGWFDFKWNGFRDENGNWQFPVGRGTIEGGGLQTDVPVNSKLWEARSDDVVRAIDDSFLELTSESPQPSRVGQHVTGYIFEGGDVYNFGEINAAEAISATVRSKNSTVPVAILDVGAGNGSFIRHIKEVYGDNVSVSGLTAHDYRTSSNPLTEFDYRLGNAEHLLDVYPEDSFDVVVSNVTVRHFRDPLGGVVQMYEALKPNGILLVDGFETPGLEGNLGSVVDFLKSKGYQVTASFDIDPELKIKDAEIEFLIIRKTHEHLDLPVGYRGVNEDGNVVYKLTGELSSETEDGGFAYLSSRKPDKYGGDPLSHYRDFRDDVSQESMKNRWQQQLNNAQNSGANWWEMRNLRKQQQAVEKAIEIYKKDREELLKNAKEIIGGEAPEEVVNPARPKGEAGEEGGGLKPLPTMVAPGGGQGGGIGGAVRDWAGAVGERLGFGGKLTAVRPLDPGTEQTGRIIQEIFADEAARSPWAVNRGAQVGKIELASVGDADYPAAVLVKVEDGTASVYVRPGAKLTEGEAKGIGRVLKASAQDKPAMLRSSVAETAVSDGMTLGEKLAAEGFIRDPQGRYVLIPEGQRRPFEAPAGYRVSRITEKQGVRYLEISQGDSVIGAVAMDGGTGVLFHATGEAAKLPEIAAAAVGTMSREGLPVTVGGWLAGEQGVGSFLIDRGMIKLPDGTLGYFPQVAGKGILAKAGVVIKAVGAGLAALIGVGGISRINQDRLPETETVDSGTAAVPEFPEIEEAVAGDAPLKPELTDTEAEAVQQFFRNSVIPEEINNQEVTGGALETILRDRINRVLAEQGEMPSGDIVIPDTRGGVIVLTRDDPFGEYYGDHNRREWAKQELVDIYTALSLSAPFMRFTQERNAVIARTNSVGEGYYGEVYSRNVLSAPTVVRQADGSYQIVDREALTPIIYLGDSYDGLSQFKSDYSEGETKAQYKILNLLHEFGHEWLQYEWSADGGLRETPLFRGFANLFYRGRWQTEVVGEFGGELGGGAETNQILVYDPSQVIGEKAPTEYSRTREGDDILFEDFSDSYALYVGAKNEFCENRPVRCSFWRCAEENNGIPDQCRIVVENERGQAVVNPIVTDPLLQNAASWTEDVNQEGDSGEKKQEISAAGGGGADSVAVGQVHQKPQNAGRQEEKQQSGINIGEIKVHSLTPLAQFSPSLANWSDSVNPSITVNADSLVKEGAPGSNIFTASDPKVILDKSSHQPASFLNSKLDLSLSRFTVSDFIRNQNLTTDGGMQSKVSAAGGGGIQAYAAEGSSARIMPLSMYRALAGQILLKKTVAGMPENERSAEKIGEAVLAAAALANSISRTGVLSSNEAGYSAVSGTGGAATGAIGKGIYKVTAEAVAGIDLILPERINVGVNGDGAVMVGVTAGKGKVKVVGGLELWEKPMLRLGEWIEKKLVPAARAANIEGLEGQEGREGATPAVVPLVVQLFVDENKNGKMDEGEDLAKLAGVKVNLVSETKTVSYNLTEGWNFVAFPLAPESVKTAADLVQDVALDGGYVTTVATWEQDKWMEFSQRGGQKFGQDFELQPGRAYFLNSHSESTWTLAGTPLPAENRTLQLRKGWNGVGLPAERATTAVQVMDEIQITDNREQRTVGGEVADQVGRWDFGLWEVVVKRRYSAEHHEIYGRDFPVKPEEGYFIHANEDVRFQ